MQIITRQTLDDLAATAADRPRLRANLNMHPQLEDPIQRMLNCGQPGTYVRPHVHGAGRWESFVLLRGSITVLQFTPDGVVTQRTDLTEQDVRIIELPGEVWHSILFTQPDSTVFELKPGPYSPASDKDFAPWAPLEGMPETAAFLEWMTHAQPGDQAP